MMSLLAALTWPEVAEAIPIILSLIIIEGLLSVDNALAIAAMASHLPTRQKYLALKFGIIGAYVFRGVALALAAQIIENPWLKILGAAYLIHLMCTHFADKHRKQQEEAKLGLEAAKLGGKSFLATVASIELMDLSLSVDNVVAAVALSDKLWVVCTGVFIGILALRLVAGYCIKLIEKYPVLEHVAFLLIGYVGGLLVFEMTTHIDIHTREKFFGIVLIMALSIWYSKRPLVQTILRPFVASGMLIMRGYALITGFIVNVLTFPFRAAYRLFRREQPVPVVEEPR